MNNEFNNQNMNQFESNSINNKNDSWKNVLIVILVIISLFLTALTIYVVVDKKDNNEDGNKDNNIQENETNNDNNENEEFDVEKAANDYFNSFKNMQNLNFNFVDDVGTVINDDSTINVLKESVEIIEIVEKHLGADKYIYEIDNIKDISEENKISGIIYYYAKEKFIGERVEDAASAEKVKQKYYEVYGQNVNFINEFDESNGNLAFTDKGSNYTIGSHTCSFREKTNMFVCRPTSGGTGPESSGIIKYIYNYKKDAEYYYVYVSVGRYISYSNFDFSRQLISSEVNDLKIYKDSDNDGELYNFKIDETNYKDFEKYRYTFKLNDDGTTFKFVSLDRVK